MFAAPGNVVAYFQPLVSLGARRVIGFTAHPLRPGDEVLRTACRAAADWPDGITLGVELPEVRWRNPALGLQVMSALNESGLAAGRLELEIAEDVLARDYAPIVQAIERLRHAGVMVALTGCGRAQPHVSIGTFDTVKFCAAMVQRLGQHARSDMIAEELIRVADQYGVVSAADGIVADAQIDMLHMKGVAQGQGALFGKPLPAREVADMLRAPSVAVA
jgi:EAL domain-containing protein (putative c-di-GMP-specific phosphodiesterase class I)